MNARKIWIRPLLWIAGAGVGAVLLIALASALAGSLAIAEQPGRSIGVPAVSVQPSGAATPAPTPSTEPTSTQPTSTEPTVPTSATPEVVPAQDPVVVDDHGGDNPGHNDDIGGSSSSGGKGG